MGLTNNFRKVVKGYGLLARPLIELLKKDTFQWDNTTQDSFEQIKKAMTTTYVLTLPKFSKEFFIEYACGNGIEVILM